MLVYDVESFIIMVSLVTSFHLFSSTIERQFGHTQYTVDYILKTREMRLPKL